ncbi:MAG: hypothetical protein HZA52_09440 [Planctomycetes bacterium]|nr:hypothetical protein [Planctomycetota bacterium]
MSLPTTSTATSTTGAPTGAGRRVFERWLFWPLALLLLALAVELGHRAQRIVTGRPYLDARATERVAKLAEENVKIEFARPSTKGAAPGADTELLPHPYVAILSRAHVRTLERAVAAMRDAARTELDVVIVGGVGAQVFAGAARERLIEALPTLPGWQGRKVAFWSFADPYVKEPQQLELVLYLTSLGAVPELVIDVSGRNELLIGSANALADMHPAYPARAQWQPLVFGGATDRASLDLLVTAWSNQREIAAVAARAKAGWIHCSLWAGDAIDRIEHLALERDLVLTSYQRRSEAAQRELVLRGPTPPTTPTQRIATSAGIWFQSTRDLASLCAARGIRFVVAVEPFEEPHHAAKKRSESNGEKAGAGRTVLLQAAKRLTELGTLWIDAAELAEAKQTPREVAAALVDEMVRRLAAE